MKYCDQCHIEISTEHEYCPLCHQVLKGDNKGHVDDLYPSALPPRREVLPLTRKIISFIMLISIMILAIINLLTSPMQWWSLIPIGSILYGWMIVRVGILSKSNIAMKLVFLTAVLIIILNVIDRLVGEESGWALNYVTPFALIACSVAISMIIWIKRINYRDYYFYLITILFFGIVPFILYLFHVINVLWPSVVSISVVLFILLFIIFFFPKTIKEEMKKRFHI